MLQDDRQADRGDQRREPRRAPQRAVGDAFEREADRHAHRDRRERADQHDRERRQRRAGADQRDDDRVGDHRADHHHLAVREIDELDDPVDHRVAQRDDRVDAAERRAVDELLDEDVHCQGDRGQVTGIGRRTCVSPWRLASAIVGGLSRGPRQAAKKTAPEGAVSSHRDDYFFGAAGRSAGAAGAARRRRCAPPAPRRRPS